MASLLAKFRIDYSDLELLTDMTKKAEDSTYYYFKDLIRNFTSKELCDNPSEGKILFDYKIKINVINCNKNLHFSSNDLNLMCILQLFLSRKVNWLPLKTKQIVIYDYVKIF